MLKRSLSLCLALCMLLGLYAFAQAESTAPVKLTVGQQANTFVIDYKDNYLTKLLESKLNIDVEFYMLPLDSAELRTKLSLMVTSGDLPDIINVDNALPRETILDYGSKGAFIPMNDYLADPEITPNYQLVAPEDKATMLTAITSADGNIYVLPKFEPETWNLTASRMYMNYAWLDKLGLSAPATTDELYDVLAAFRDGDPNGNGQQDEIGVYGYFSGGYGENIILPLLNAFVFLPNASSLTLDETGETVIAPFTSEAFQKGLVYLNKLYSDGLLDASLFTADQQQYRAVLNNEINIVGITSAGSLSNWPDVQNNPNFDEMDIITPLTGPDGAKYAPYTPYSPGLSFFITSKCSDPVTAMKLGDLFLSEEVSNVARFGEPEVDYTHNPEEMKGTSNAYVEAGLYDDLYLAYKTSIWSEPASKHWHNMNPRYATLDRGNRAGDLVNPYDPTLKTNKYNAVNYEYYYPAHPEYVLPQLTYTLDEAEATSETITLISDYMKEAIAEFTTGARDPQTDWTSYLSDLESFGLPAWLEAAQSAYDRVK
jgi:putative aldouronate transport system substrate-binding protein